jgi:hypothetical protein
MKIALAILENILNIYLVREIVENASRFLMTKLCHRSNVIYFILKLLRPHVLFNISANASKV